MGSIVTNKKAKFEYELIETLTAGIMLQGYEIKPIKNAKCNLTEGHCYFQDGELFIKNLSISESVDGDINRPKKLLLNRKELDKLVTNVAQKGLTIIPIKLFLNNRGLIKLEIALAKGKKLHDKRNTIKARDIERENKEI
jgi:SsrA-binding protein